MKHLIWIFAMLVCIACDDKSETELTVEKEKFTRVYNDDFTDTIQPFWRTNQITHPDRLQIVTDPLNADNDVMKISLEKGDRIAKGYRNEIVVNPKDSFGYLNKYSYRFMFPESFFQKEEKKGIIVLNQWHDEPYPGFTWATKKIKARPPFAMYVEHTPEGEFYMILHSGIRMGNVDEMKISRWPGKLEPNKWYTFEADIFWSIYEDGYVKPKINDLCFEFDGVSQCTFQATNMYHKIPNYFKWGLYWSGTQENNRYIYYDDFKMNTERIGYFPPQKKLE
ncbi:hypothetical protein G5B37_10170 [Rasiella rasia]|uniref:Uncharacterized protein n=1 Tax=Rasiella rasia TaxID=2744027 RepID=A0A6G6GMV8_9FLAO|nr:heparin lyase I family protein [Rasiella rasia]QIE59916.1 hypothetical protein G5B37_10170 [Rasiella rasia]